MADIVEKIDAGQEQNLGYAYVGRPANVQEGDANHRLETYGYTGPDPASWETKMTGRLLET